MVRGASAANTDPRPVHAILQGRFGLKGGVGKLIQNQLLSSVLSLCSREEKGLLERFSSPIPSPRTGTAPKSDTSPRPDAKKDHPHQAAAEADPQLLLAPSAPSWTQTGTHLYF